jgi:Ca-activated chloride channel family protein
LKRVILLSDGQANEGLTDAAAIAAQCAEWAARGVTTSTYGLGNSFNEELMVAMARAGGGNHYYGDTAEDLMDPFQQELELLGNLCLRDLRLSAAVRMASRCRWSTTCRRSKAAGGCRTWPGVRRPGRCCD